MKHGGRVLILLLSLLFLVLNINVVYAESNVIVIDSVETVGGTIDVDSPVLDSNKITSKIKFENKDDYITFKLNIKNNDTQPLYFKSVSDNNTINNLSITYDYSEGLVNPNEITSIKVTFKYTETVKNVDKVNIDNLVIKLLFVDEEGETKGDDIIINPTTHDSILKYIIWLVIAFVGIVLLFIYIKDKKLKYSVFVLCFSLIIIPTIIYANGEYESNAIFTDIELVGEYETYEINIYNKDRNVVGTKTITYGQKVGTLTHDEVPGYTFDKYVDENGNEVTEDTVITSSIKIYQIYTPNTYEVVFDKNNEYAEGSMNNQQMTYDTEANFDDTTYTYTGYHLTGWNTNPAGTGTSYSVNTPVKNIATEGTITLYAEWEENTDTPYVVIHKQQQLNGSYVEVDRDELTGTSDAQITPAVKSYTGFTSPTAVTTTISRFGTTEVVYEYDRIPCELTITDRTYLSNGSSANGTYMYGETITLTAQERNNYNFKWSDDDTNYTKQFTITEDVTLSLVYSARTYQVVFDKNSEFAEGTMDAQTLTYDTAANLTTNSFTYTGYHFNGWNTVAGGTGTSYADGAEVTNITDNNSITLYAQWEANTNTQYVVIHKQQQLDGLYVESDRDELTGTSDASITPAVKSYTGFTSPTAVTTTISRFGTTEVVYEYDRLPCELTITDRTYLSNGSSANGTYMYGETIILTAQERNHYDFKWSDNDTNYTKQFTITEDITLETIYTLERVTVTFDSNGGGEVNSITVDYGETIQSFTTPTAPLNKAFAGWYTSLTDGVEITVPYTPESDITLIAHWNDDLFPTVFSEPGECTFNGSTGVLTGTNCSYADGERKYIDTGIQLYNSENRDKDYEIGFTIVSYNSSDQVSQATFMNTKHEASGYPGLVFRRKDNESGYDLSSRKTSSANERKVFSGIVIDQVKIWRIKNKDTGTQEIFYKINDGKMVKLNDLSSYNPEFELNVWFGAAPTDEQANAAQRILVGTMKDMYIKLGTYQDEVPVEYTATYDANGGIVTTTSKTVNKNEQIGELPIPTAPITMEFDGWYTGISDGIKIDETYLLNDDVTLYARYNSLCGTFSTDSWDEIVSNLNNDSSYYPVGCEKEIMVNNTTYPVRLINTTTNENCNTSSDISQTGCGPVIEFSRKIGSRPMSNSYWNDGGWKESSLRSYLNSTFYNSLSDDLKNVIIDTNPVVSGSGKGGVSANANDKVFVLALSEVGRHDFNYDTKSGMRTLDYYLLKDLPGFKIHLGWLRTAQKSSNSNYFLGMGGSVASADYSTGEVTPAFRIGIKPKYIVSFDTDEGSSVTSQTITYGAKATRPTTDPTKEGYTFDNWYTDDTYTTVFDFDNTVITSDTTIYAKFKVLSNVILPTGRTKDNLEVGDEVCINGDTIECFNFIRYDGNNIVLLSKWNLKVGTINEVVSGTLVEIGRYTDSDEGYGVQSSDVRGAVANGLWNGTLPFAASFYWADGSGIKSKYGGLRDSNDIFDIDYSSEPDFNNLGYRTPGYSVAYYVRNYENILKSYGAPIKTSRLITYDEVTDPSIGCNHEEWNCPTTGFITNTTFWLGSAHDDTYIWLIDTGGYFSNGDINDYSSGIRPVVIIDKADL